MSRSPILPYAPGTSPAAPVMNQHEFIDNGVLLSDLDANGKKILNLDTSAYALDASQVVNTAGLNGQRQTAGYLIATFLFGESRLRLMFSADGKEWAPVASGPVQTTQNVGDPSLLHHNGRWYAAYTGEGTPYKVGILYSDDLVTWAKLPIGNMPDFESVGTPGLAWAPELFKDDDGTIRLYIGFRFTPALGGAAYPEWGLFETHCTTDDLVTNAPWTAFTRVSGTFAAGWPEMIDPFMIKREGTYYLFYKNETAKEIEYASGPTATGPFTIVENGDWAGWGNGWEGFSMIPLPGVPNGWRAFLDKEGKGLYYSDSLDDWETWTTPAYIKSFDVADTLQSLNFSHPSIFPLETIAQHRDVVSAMGGRALQWQRAFTRLKMTPVVDQFDDAIGIDPHWLFVGRRASIRFDGWAIGQDLPAAGVKDFYISNGGLPAMRVPMNNTEPVEFARGIVPRKTAGNPFPIILKGFDGTPHWGITVDTQTPGDDHFGIYELGNNGTTFDLRLGIDKNTNDVVCPTGIQVRGAVPVAANSAGTTGMIRTDADYIYVCVAPNTWKRAALASW